MIRRLLLPALLLAALLPACSPNGMVAPGSDDSPAPAGARATSAPTAVFTATPLPPPDLPIAASPDLLQIDFQSTRNGWGLAEGAVVRTVDGGATWHDASPPEVGIGYSTRLFALDDQHAWLQVPNPDFYTGTLFRTTDGGLNWDSFAVPFGGVYFQFLDASTGRVLADRGAGAGSQVVEVFQSGDGGATWTSVFHNDPVRPGWSESLPLGGIKNGMTFLDADTGWVTGVRPVDGETYLFVTHDGGLTWAMQPLPAGCETCQSLPQPPLFFGSRGLLPVIFQRPGGTELSFFFSNDGGLTWSGGSSGSIPPGRCAFADAPHGWCWDGGPGFYVTEDGAQSWVRQAATLDLGSRLIQLDFVPARTGWALAGPSEGVPARLYRTDDGGLTWTMLTP